MEPVLAIIGTAGRRDDADRLNAGHWERMCAAAREIASKEGITRLVSGGAAWADHVAVELASSGAYSADIWLPARPEDLDTARYYHRRFSSAIGRDTFAQIDSARETGSISVGSIGGFKDRNARVASAATCFLACTFGSGAEVKDGGTADTVSRLLAAGKKGWHLDLNTGLLHAVDSSDACFGKREESKPGSDAGYQEKALDRAYLDEPPQPDLSSKPPRLRARGSQSVGGVRFFSPSLPPDGTKVQILCVGVAPTPEEASGILEGSHGTQITQTPRLLKGPLGTIVPDAMDRYPRLKSGRMAFTVLTPWLLPRTRRFKPTSEEIAWAAPLLHDLIEETKPEIIVAFGKLAFDQLVNLRISHTDARGGWFSYKDTEIPVYLMEPTSTYVLKPWSIDVLLTDFKEVNRMVEFRSGVDRNAAPLDLRIIDTMDQLRDLVAEWREGGYREFSTDCEWHGSVYTDGDLRSIQFSWHPSKAAYLRFYDENGWRYLGSRVSDGWDLPAPHKGRLPGGTSYTDYRAVGQILGEYLNGPDIRYTGHQASADMPWMEYWLGLDVIGRFSFDTLYAMQTVDEYSPLGLDDLALRMTDFGRYDMPLVMWKREHRTLCADGYGKIPDSILIPYAQLDVLVPMRVKPQLERMLANQDLTRYYRSFVLPFVTDTFHTWTTTGLPVDPELFGLTRKFMNWAYRVLLEDFRKAMAEQADALLAARSGIDLQVVQPLAALRDRDPGKAAAIIMSMWSEPDADVIGHWQEVREFNIRSHPQLARWLFKVLGLTPVKSTKANPMGMSVMWTRVLELQEKFQKDFVPAVDKETLELLQEADETGMIPRLLAVSNVGNQCKGFLKEGEYTEDGELVEENGLAKYIDSTGRIRPNMGLTETGRPRTFNPNVLNLSAYHNKGVVAGLSRILATVEIPEEFHVLFGAPETRVGIKHSDLVKERMPSIRSVVKASPGWCGVECDYKTAEIRGKAFISGDANLIELLTGVDACFGVVDVGGDQEPVRLSYPPGDIIAPEHAGDAYLLSRRAKSGIIKVDPADLLRDADGKLIHPKHDLHWSLAEFSQHKPREIMDDKTDRGGAKVGNFSGAYGAVGTTLERRIEALTGIKPPEGFGNQLLEAIKEREPVAVAFLDDTAEMPRRGIPLRAQSGRIRHFPVHSSELRGMPQRVRNSYLRAMGNEARNFYMQESVAATMSRACTWLNRFFRDNGMQARTGIGLYDAVLTWCPLEERFVVADAKRLFMDTLNVWCYHGRYMSYPIDTDFVYRWSCKPSAEDKKKLKDRSFHPMEPERENRLLGLLRTAEDMFFGAQPWIKPRLNTV